MKRGFKTQSNELAGKIRKNLGLSAYTPFDPFAYARMLDVSCEAVTSLSQCSQSTQSYVASNEGQPQFSAVTVYFESQALIVYNDNNTTERQRSDIAHELAHIILKHEPRPVISIGGCRTWDQGQTEQEEEASWLSGALLVPENGALMVTRKELTLEEAAAVFEVSVELIRYRINVTGARARVKRMRRGA